MLHAAAAGGEVVVVVLRVVVRERGEPAKLRHRPPVDGSLDAPSDTADIGKHGQIADDARALRDAQQAVLEVPHGRPTAGLQVPAEAHAPSRFTAGLGLDHVADRVEARGRGAERPGGAAAGESADVLRRSSEQLELVGERQLTPTCGRKGSSDFDRAGLVGTGDRVCLVLDLHGSDPALSVRSRSPPRYPAGGTRWWS